MMLVNGEVSSRIRPTFLNRALSYGQRTVAGCADFMPVQTILVIATCCLSSFAVAGGLPAPPRTFDTTYATPKGKVINVAADGDFQAALNGAQPGDTIVLRAGATYVGPFALPNKARAPGWIYVISSAARKLPMPGSRVVPRDSANMPKVVSPEENNALVTTANAHQFRFVGIEFAPVTGAVVSNLIAIGNADLSPATLPNHIVFDRCYIHGDQNVEDRRGILMNGAYLAVIDSYISDFKQRNFDSQALAAYNGTGPFKIANNYLEAAGENVIFGGADSAAPSLVPADIEISRNNFAKPLALIGSGYTVKNLLEFKAAKRALVSENVFRNNPAASQSGFALLVTPRNQDGNAPWSITSDIAIIGNTFVNVGSGLNIAGKDDIHSSLPTARILIRNNLLGVTGLNGADGRAFQILSAAADVTIDHNTIINTANPAITCCSDILMVDNGSNKANVLIFSNNLSIKTTYGIVGSALAEGTATLNGEFASWTFQRNVIVGANSNNYPAGNFFPADLQAVRFSNYADGDYRLAADSPYKGAGTDGRDIGAAIPPGKESVLTGAIPGRATSGADDDLFK